MRNNIIAIVIFFGFIATVFGIGYAVSRDTMPMHQGRVPNISTAGGQSIDRDGVKDALALQQVSTEPISHVANGRVASGRVASGEWTSGDGSVSGGLRSTSSQQLKSYGGGGAASGMSGSSGGSKSNVSSGNSSGGGSFSLLARRDNRTPAEQKAEEIGIGQVSAYNPPSLRSEDDWGDTNWEDPFPTPVGDIPWVMIVLTSILCIVRKKKSLTD